MAASTPNTSAVPQDTLITIKISVNDSLKKLKLPLRDLGANVLPDKLRSLLAIQPEQTVVFERFSDSFGGYIKLDPNNPQVFKTLIRAAKAKLKLRLKATVSPLPEQSQTETSDACKDMDTHNAVDPVIVKSPVYQMTPRNSTAFDLRSVGSGIFQFREARASPQALADTSEAPVLSSFQADSQHSIHCTGGNDPACSKETPGNANDVPLSLVVDKRAWSVCCNECDVAMADVHFHCSICDGGDYDLCENCVASGKRCRGEDHWMIKRFIKDGMVVNSVSSRWSPSKAKLEPTAAKTSEQEWFVPGAFSDNSKASVGDNPSPTRTCNSCVVVRSEDEFVTCARCEDFDLCIKCHIDGKHGHHPAHPFKPATSSTDLPSVAESLLGPCRNVHHNAICDGCDKIIVGVRHKCLNCPDWDYCASCIEGASDAHPSHRFVPIYEPLAVSVAARSRHVGIFCDGPLCKDKLNLTPYITGIRYKCAVCPDFDLCANCEASPLHTHNRTHPMIKFKTPVQGVSITTENVRLDGSMRLMGDRLLQPPHISNPRLSPSIASQSSNGSSSASRVQTVAEIKPSVQEVATKPEEINVSQPCSSFSSASMPAASNALNAVFVKDSVPDGMVVQPSTRFTQVWHMRNPGPNAWPAGCSVRFVGGDNMLNIDNNHPAGSGDIKNASESNVVAREVLAGEEVAFKVPLKAPAREGKCISYWRLKSADGVPFGHRLWCDVDVKGSKPRALPVQTRLEGVKAKADLTRLRAEILRQKHRPAIQQQQMHDRALQDLKLQQMLSQEHAKKMNFIRGNLEATAQTQRRSKMPSELDSTAMTPACPCQARNPCHEETFQIPARTVIERQLCTKPYDYHPDLAGDIRALPATPEVAHDMFPDQETQRKELAKKRVEKIKAHILHLREEKEKEYHKADISDLNAKAEEMAHEVIPESTAAGCVTAPMAKPRAEDSLKKMLQAVSEDSNVVKDEDEEIQRSQMVFPRLDKESPASSTYQIASEAPPKGKPAYVENEDGEVERSASPLAEAGVDPEFKCSSAAHEDDFDNLTDDLEVLSADGEVSDEDSFLTDEEYDILDASDHETVASK